jgi:hypothetical protein
LSPTPQEPAERQHDIKDPGLVQIEHQALDLPEMFAFRVFDPDADDRRRIDDPALGIEVFRDHGNPLQQEPLSC